MSNMNELSGKMFEKRMQSNELLKHMKEMYSEEILGALLRTNVLIVSGASNHIGRR